MAKRKALSPRTRFEVFKRDGFQCQYCGKSAPEVVLRVDHINPVANGGDNDILNLVTACIDCNAGKSDKLLSDHSTVELQVEQLQILNERRVQLEMMLEWKKSVRSLVEVEVSHAAEYWQQESETTLTESGLSGLRKVIKQFGLDEVIAGIEIACRQYTDRNKAFQKIGGICYVRKKRETDPSFESQAMVRGILAKRGMHIGTALPQIINDAIDAGYTHEQIVTAAKTARCWTAFYETFLEGGE